MKAEYLAKVHAEWLNGYPIQPFSYIPCQILVNK